MSEDGVRSLHVAGPVGRRLLGSSQEDNAQRIVAYGPLNNFYETHLFVGSEHQNISFVVDTGSSWTWVTYNNCTAPSLGKVNRSEEAIVQNTKREGRPKSVIEEMNVSDPAQLSKLIDVMATRVNK